MASKVEERDPPPTAQFSSGGGDTLVEAPTQPKSSLGGSESSVEAQSLPGLSSPNDPSEASDLIERLSGSETKPSKPIDCIENTAAPYDPSEASGSKSSDVIEKGEVEIGTEPASELSGSETKLSKPIDAVEKTVGNVEVDGDGGDKESRDTAEATTSLLAGMSVSNNPTDVDTPQIVLKSDRLNEDVESEETSSIKTEYVDDTPYTSAKTFEDLNLSENLLRGLYSEMKFERPSRIQGATLPMILTPPYHNLIAQAHNGSGKTTCFVLGMLSRVDPQLRAPQAICVCPTRELAIQNEQVLLKMGKFTGITSVCGIPSDASGYSSTRRERIIDQVAIGTPGTLKRWISFRTLDTRHIKILVFDEADHMLAQDGFQDDSVRIIQQITKSHGSCCQVLLFSATFDDKVKDFATRIIPRANHVFVKKEELSLDVIKQYRVKCPNAACKTTVLKDRIFPAAEKLGQSIIFVRTRTNASELHWRLEADGHKCTSIHGGLSNEDRDQVIREFRGGQTKILIATDVLARGFDQAQVTLVVNYDLPMKHNYPVPDYELYLHRIGRSGRFGRKGAAFNLVVTRQEEENLDKIARHFNRHIPEVQWDNDDDFETVLKDAGLA